MPATRFKVPPALVQLIANTKEVDRLLEIHVEVSGSGSGRPSGVEVLNKSAIVLLVACWESYVEDVATRSFDFVLKKARSHDDIPTKVLTGATKDLRESDNHKRIWELAGEGWKAVLQSHRERVLERFVRPFHSPKAQNIDLLFRDLLGVATISNSWSWPGMSAARSVKKLDQLIALRGEIAHKVKTSEPVRKSVAAGYVEFVFRLSAELSNSVGQYLTEQVSAEPWHNVVYLGSKAKRRKRSPG